MEQTAEFITRRKLRRARTEKGPEESWQKRNINQGEYSKKQIREQHVHKLPYKSKINLSECRFFLHAVKTLVSFDCELASPPRESERRSRRTIVKIEFFVASHPISLTRNLYPEKTSREADALAACCGDVFHGVRRHIRNRSDRERGRLRPRNPDPSVSTGAVVPPDRVYDR